MIKIADGKEQVYELRYGAEPVRLPGREGTSALVDQPGRSAGLGVEIYLMRSKIEETFRFLKQTYHPLLSHQRLRNLVVLLPAAA